MKYRTTCLLLFFTCLHCLWVAAQSDCYEKYKGKGDAAVRSRQWPKAIKLYQAAKLCDTLSYERMHKLDELINSTYETWIKASEEARILAEDAAVKSQLESANRMFLEGRFRDLNATLQASPYKSHPLVTHYLAAIAPLVPDFSLDKVSGFDTLSFDGKQYIAFLREESKKVNLSRKKKPGNASRASEEGSGTADAENMSLTLFSVLDPSGSSLREVYSTDIPQFYPVNGEYKLKKSGDSLLVVSGSARAYWFDPVAGTLKNISYRTNDATDAEFDTVASTSTMFYYQKLANDLAKFDISLVVTKAQTEIQAQAQADTSEVGGMMIVKKNGKANTNTGNAITFFQNKDRSKAKQVENIEDAAVVEKTKQLVVARYSDSAYSYEIQVYTLPALELLRTIEGVTSKPGLYNIDYTDYLLPYTTKQERDVKTGYYDLLTNRLIQFEEKPGEYYYASSWRRTPNGFLSWGGAYVKFYDKNGVEKKRFNDPSYSTTPHYFPESNKLLILKHQYNDYEATSTRKTNRNAKSNTLAFDTLKVFFLNNGDSASYAGDRIDFLTDSLVSISGDTGVRILDVSAATHKTEFSLGNVLPVKTDKFNNYLWIKFKEAGAKNNDTTTIVYSLKQHKTLFKTERMITENPSDYFFCATDNPLKQDLLYIDTLTEEIKHISVNNVARKDLFRKKIYYKSGYNLFYAVSSNDVSEEEEEKLLKNMDYYGGMLLNIGKVDVANLIKLFNGSVVEVYHPNRGKIRTIVSTGNVDDYHPLMFAGNFIFFSMDSRNGLLSDSESSDLDQYLFYKIPSLK